MPLPPSLHLQWATRTANKKKHILLENMPFRLTRNPHKTPPSLISCHEFFFNIPNFSTVLYEYMVKLLARIKQEASKAICTFKVCWIHTLKSKAICTFKVFDLKDIKPNEFVNYGLACLEHLARVRDSCAKETREKLRVVFVDQFPYPLMLMLESETTVIVVKILVKKKKKMMMMMVMVMNKRMQMMMAMSTRMMCDCHANNV